MNKRGFLRWSWIALFSGALLIIASLKLAQPDAPESLPFGMVVLGLVLLLYGTINVIFRQK